MEITTPGLLLVAVLAGAAPRREPVPITTAGWGAVRVGMTPARAAARLGGRLVTRKGALEPESCHYRSSPRAPGLLFMVVEGRIARVETKDARYATLSGVRVGDSEETALRTYAGRSQVLPHKYTDTGKYIVVATSDGQRAVVVETDQGRVTQIRGGQRPAVEYVEGCS
jgi:hypothetical protein